MTILKKLTFMTIFCTAVVAGCFAFKSSHHPIEEGKNFFQSPIYTHYKLQLKTFIQKHSAYVHVKHAPSTAYNVKVKALIEEIEKLPDSPQEQRISHELLIKKMRELALIPGPVGKDEKEAKHLFEEIVQWLFLGANLQSDMKDFLYNVVPPPTDHMLTYLQETQKRLQSNPQFYGVKHDVSSEDQLLHGNLPSHIAFINHKTQLIRLGQPICLSSRALWWWESPQVSPEFLLFLQQQPRHLYVNLMKRKGVESSPSTVLEALEKHTDHFYVITLDKNSSFYWQDEKEFPEIMESSEFKKVFLDKMCAEKGNYFWSKHLNRSLWQQELQDILNQVHISIFQNQKVLNRIERRDFIELTYLAILDHLVDKWTPTSMNITCRQGIDRGPSLMVLWMLQKGLIDKKDMAALLLAPPLIMRNRASHAPKIERFISAAKRLEFIQMQQLNMGNSPAKS